MSATTETGVRPTAVLTARLLALRGDLARVHPVYVWECDSILSADADIEVG